jgi:hypothetical protein
VSPCLELAVSLVSKSLTLFVGTGLSKYLTGNKAPSWFELLIDLTTRIDDKKGTLTAKLFNTESDGRKAVNMISTCSHRYSNSNTEKEKRHPRSRSCSFERTHQLKDG